MPVVEGVVDACEIERRRSPDRRFPAGSCRSAGAIAPELLVGEGLDSSGERCLLGVGRPSPAASIARVCAAAAHHRPLEPRWPIGGVELAGGPTTDELCVCCKTEGTQLTKVMIYADMSGPSLPLCKNESEIVSDIDVTMMKAFN